MPRLLSRLRRLPGWRSITYPVVVDDDALAASNPSPLSLRIINCEEFNANLSTKLLTAAPIAALVAIGFVTPAHAQAATLTPAEIQQVQAAMTDADINPTAQASLPATLESGKPLDSTKGETLTRTFVQERPEGTRTVKEFADGSGSWVGLQRANTATDGRTSMNGCSSSEGWRVNCRIDISDLVSSAWFRIDYKPSGNAQVRDFRGRGCSILGGDCSVNGKIARATQSSAGPAWAYLNYKVSTWTWIGASGQIGSASPDHPSTSTRTTRSMWPRWG